MNILIANSEIEKSDQLAELLYQYDHKINILGKPSTINETIELFVHKSSEIDLSFLDIKLTHDSIFKELSNGSIPHPIVYTSPSKQDAYAAIKANGIDFLLEPFCLEDVTKTINKFYSQIENISYSKMNFKRRFIIKFGDKIQFKSINDVSYIFAEGKLAYLVTRSTNRRYIIEHTLDELEKQHLDPSFFFRINRKFIVHIDAFEEARNYVNSRLKLIINPPTDFDLVVSREKINDFKNWLNL